MSAPVPDATGDQAGAGATWRVECYDSAWGGWRTVEGGNGLAEWRARKWAARLEAGSTFEYRARQGVQS